MINEIFEFDVILGGYKVGSLPAGRNGGGCFMHCGMPRKPKENVDVFPSRFFHGDCSPIMWCGVEDSPHCLTFFLLLVELCIWNEVLLCVSFILDYMYLVILS